MDRLVAPSRTWTQMVFEILYLVFGVSYLVFGMSYLVFEMMYFGWSFFVDGGSIHLVLLDTGHKEKRNMLDFICVGTSSWGKLYFLRRI